MERRQKSSEDGLDPEPQSSNPDTLPMEAGSTHQNPRGRHAKPTNTPAPKEPVPQLGFLPTGWESRLADNGKVYFVDHNTKTTTWLDPSKDQPSHSDDLPNQWEISQADNGRTYFIDHSTRTTTWEDPRSTNTHAREASVPELGDLPSRREQDLSRKGETTLEGRSLLNRPTTLFPLRAKI